MIRPRKENDHDNSALIKKGELKTLSPGMKYCNYSEPCRFLAEQTEKARFQRAVL